MVTGHHGWAAAIMVMELFLALDGKALQVLVDLPTEQHDNLATLTTALQRRFKQGQAVWSARWLLLERWGLMSG